MRQRKIRSSFRFIVILIPRSTGGSSCVGNGLALADEAAVASTMDAAFEEQLKEGAEAFEFQAEVR